MRHAFRGHVYNVLSERVSDKLPVDQLHHPRRAAEKNRVLVIGVGMVATEGAFLGL